MTGNSKERGMIFNAEMVRAILSGQKTQTRRIVKYVTADNCMTLTKPSKPRDGVYTHVMDAPKHGLCPHGNVGDRIWVRETWQGPLVDFERSDDLLRNPEKYEKPENCVYAADGVPAPEFYDADDNLRCCWRPSIHMPRWASRILLEITNVRVERLNDISEQDAIAEGIDTDWLAESQDNYDCIADHNMTGRPTAKGHFSYLWQSIYGDDKSKCWEKNPWVWVIEFKRVQEQSND